MSKTEIYDAQGAYLQNQRDNKGPGNVPAHLMTKIRAASLNALGATIQSPDDAAIIAGLSGSLLQWDGLSKMEKIGKVPDLQHGEVKALLGVEDDNEVLIVLLNRKKEIDKQRKG